MKPGVSLRAGSLVSAVAASAALCMLNGGLAPSQSTNRDPVVDNSVQLVSQGRQIFRFDTFGVQLAGSANRDLNVGAIIALVPDCLSLSKKSDLVQYLLSLTFGSSSSEKGGH